MIVLMYNLGPEDIQAAAIIRIMRLRGSRLLFSSQMGLSKLRTYIWMRVIPTPDIRCTILSGRAEYLRKWNVKREIEASITSDTAKLLNQLLMNCLRHSIESFGVCSRLNSSQPFAKIWQFTVSLMKSLLLKVGL
jgi:hypothetical protein